MWWPWRSTSRYARCWPATSTGLSDAVYALARLQEDLTQEERLRAQVTALVRKQLSAPEGGLPPFSLASLQRMAQRAVERAGQLGVPVVFSAVDSGGNLVLLQRMEGALLGSVDVSAGKAYTGQRLPDADP